MRGLVLLGLLLAPVALAQDVQGFVEVRGSWTAGVAGPAWQIVERIRPTLELELHPRLTLSSTLEISALQGRTLTRSLEAVVDEATLDLDATVRQAIRDTLDDCLRPPGLDQPWRALGQHLQLDRLHLDVYLPGIDLRVGRQALQWGSGLLINPTDPMPEVLFTEPWRPRRGVNAVRATVPIGEVHQVQAVVSVDDRFRYVRAAARGTLNAGGADLSLVGAYRGDANNGLIGLDLRGAWAVGVWVEAALHLGAGGYGEGVYEEFTVGLDYVAPVLERIVIAGQYYRTGRRSTGLPALTGALPLHGEDCAWAPDPADLPVTDPFASPLTGNDYLLLSVLAGLVPELSIGVVGLQNLGDGSGVVVPTVTTRPTEWLSIALSAQLPYQAWGEGGEFRPTEDQLRGWLAASGVAGGALLALDPELGGLVPDASVALWARANF